MRYTKKQVEKAGFDLISYEINSDTDLFHQTMNVLTDWRDSHISALDEAEKFLKAKVEKADNKAFIAKRIKRTESIIKKLKRFNKMSLKNMQDIGGIRVVLANNGKVNQLFNLLCKENVFLSEIGGLKFKNYIKEPKEDGYRSIHIIGRFKNNVGEDKNIEVQLRTQLQHCWATSLEIIDLFTHQNLKLNQGKPEWHLFFKLVSNQFEIIENLRGFKTNSQNVLIKEYIDFVKHKDNIKIMDEAVKIHNFVTQPLAGSKYSIEELFQDYAQSLHSIDKVILQGKAKQGYVLLRLNVLTGNLDTEYFEKSEYAEASNKYSLYETTLAENKSWVVALVSSNAVGGIREAYPNYFADSKVFWSYISLIKQAAFVGYYTNQARNKAS